MTPGDLSRKIGGRVRRVPSLAWKMASWGMPRRLVLFGALSLGDDVMCTAVFREWRRRGEKRLWMMSRNAGLFVGNTDIDRVVPVDDYHALLLGRLGVTVVRPYYFGDDKAGERVVPPPRHILAEMCRMAGITGEVALRPNLHLDPSEVSQGRLSSRQAVIHSSGMSAGFPMPNKEWIAGRFQEVVRLLAGEFDFVQLGSPSDSPLEGARDLRGKTSLRETAALVAASRIVVAQEGFLTHLARAVDTRAVVVYGGFSDPAVTGYSANINLTRSPPCAPCWSPSRCDFGHICMEGVTATDVADAARRLDARVGVPLAVETARIG